MASSAHRAATVRALADEGRGIAHIEGDPRPLFVAAALPGERITLTVRQWHKGYGEADLVTVDASAPARVEPGCIHFGRCGGCQLQMLGHADQLAHKEAVLARLLGPFQPLAWERPLVAEPWGYRHRARLAVERDAEGRLVLGFRAANSHRIAPISTCPVLDRRLQPLLAALPEHLNRLRDGQRVRELRIAVDFHGKVALSWTAQPALAADDEAMLKAAATDFGIIVGEEADLLYDVDAGAVGSGDSLTYRFALNDFTQVNPAVNRKLVALVVDWLEPAQGELIADAFCGLGNFSLPLGAAGAQVIGIEGEATMVARATENATRAGLGERLTFCQADLFTQPQLPPRTAKLLLDPPRAGARALCETLIAPDAPQLARIVYVSCNPHTLARDLDIITRTGRYRVARAALVDMFPQTGHIEAAVLLTAE